MVTRYPVMPLSSMQPNLYRVKPRDFHSLLDRSQEYGGGRGLPVTVGVNSVEILPGYDYRRKAVITNIGTAWVYLAKGHPALVGSGIPLAPNGGNWEETPDNLGYIFRGTFYGISSVAGQNVAVEEE